MKYRRYLKNITNQELLPTLLIKKRIFSRNISKTLSSIYHRPTLTQASSCNKFNGKKKSMKFLILDIESLIDPAELLDSKEISKELKKYQPPSCLKTDCAVVSTTKESSNQLGPELLIPLMHKIIIRNSADSAAEKIRNMFAYEYVNNRL